MPQMYDKNGNPIRPDYTPTYDPKTQSMSPMAMELTNSIPSDRRGIDQFRAEALKKGPSAYAMLANKMQNESALKARDRAAKESASTAEGAGNALAMRGGATGGARERIATSAADNLMNLNQDISSQDTMNRLQIAANDEQNHMSRLGMLPGLENTASAPDFQKAQIQLGARGQDIGRAVGEKQGQNLFDMTAYQEAMKSWAANRQANATENSGKK